MRSSGKIIVIFFKHMSWHLENGLTFIFLNKTLIFLNKNLPLS